jgi:threonine aldolase
LAELNGITIDPSKIKTNIVFFRIDRPDLTPAELTGRLKAEGVCVGPKHPDMIRAVTHYHVTAEDIDWVLKVFRKVLLKLRAPNPPKVPI